MTHKTKRLVKRTNRCETDAQCTHVDTSTGCEGTCGAWINRMYADPFERRLARMDARICGSYQADGCARLLFEKFDCGDAVGVFY